MTNHESSGLQHCQNYSRKKHEAPYSISCSLPLYQHFNNTRDPIEILQSCCPEGETATVFGDEGCWAYCNAATVEGQKAMSDCLMHESLRRMNETVEMVACGEEINELNGGIRIDGGGV